MRRTDRLALALWAGSRVVMLAISLAALASQSGTSWLGLWQRWDWDRYLTIAEFGYTSGKGPAYDTNIVAFFPGYPAVLRLVHFVVRNWVVSGLLISLVAGAVACVALARLAEFEWRARGERAGGTPGRAAVIAVLLLVCAPAAVFLAAGYTESLFLALGIPAWLAARQRRWVLAGVLTALACAVRIDGVFEAAGIGVMFLLGRPKVRDWTRAPALLLPLVAVGGYFAYLDDIKGSWLAWFTAEAQGWSRRLTSPVTAFRNSWENAFGSGGLAGAGRFGRGGSGGVVVRRGDGGSGPGPVGRAGAVSVLGLAGADGRVGREGLEKLERGLVRAGQLARAGCRVGLEGLEFRAGPAGLAGPGPGRGPAGLRAEGLAGRGRGGWVGSGRLMPGRSGWTSWSCWPGSASWAGRCSGGGGPNWSTWASRSCRWPRRPITCRWRGRRCCGGRCSSRWPSGSAGDGGSPECR
jgi:hypothetical protein